VTQYDVFLSHNSADKPAVEELARWLTGEAGLWPFLDKWHLVPGQPWQEALEEALDASRSCAVFLGPESLGTWENEEMRAALDIRAGRPDFRVIPVLLPGACLPHRGRLPRFLARLTWVDFRPGLDDADALHRLVCGIQGIAPGPEGVPETETVCPFRGLQVFEEEHAPFFFGREALTQHLVEQLREDRFLAVIGPSGSGKSSLVRAGLVPQIRQGELPASDHWPILVFKPGGDPLGALAARLIPKTVGADKWLPVYQSLLDTLQKDERGLHRVVQVMLASNPDSRRLLVAVDQFEELFTLCRDEDTRSAFVDNLLYASAIAGGQTVVVVTMRADFFGKCAAYPELAARLGERDVLVGPMGEEERCHALQRPAQVVGLHYEKGLVETILNDLGNEPGTLPLLQHTLLELWERRRGGWLTTDAYREIGGVKGAIAGRADAIYTRLTPAQQEAARRVLLRLTQPGEGTEDTRCRATLAELLPADVKLAEVKTVVPQLVDARLLTAGKIERGDKIIDVIDVAHEALIRGWPRLQRWLNEDREFLLWRQRLRAALAEWRRTDRDEGALLRGTSLAEAERWLTEQPGDLNRAERSYIQAGVAQRDREAKEREARRQRELKAVRRLRILSTIAGAGIGAGLGGFLGGILSYSLEVGLLAMPLAMLLMNVGLSSALFSAFFGSGVAFGIGLGRVLGRLSGVFPVIGGALAGALIGPLLAPITAGEAATNMAIPLGSLLGAVYGSGIGLTVVAGNKLAGWKSISARALLGAIVGGLVGTTYDGVVLSALVGLGVAVGIGIVDDLYATQAA
jgi:energy-coupling factor transporter ATP-binding protein EcfA2